MFAIVLGAILQGSGNACVSSLVDGRLIFWFIGLAFLMTAVVGQLTRWRAKRSDRHAMSFRWVVLLNVVTLVTFGAFYLSLLWLPGSFAAGVEMAVAPCMTLVIGAVRGQSAKLRSWLLAAALLAVSAAFGWSQEASSFHGVRGLVTGVVLAALAGTGTACLAVISRHLGDAGVNASDLMATRYHLTYVAAFVVALSASGASLATVSAFAWLAPLGLAAVVLPLSLIQFGMMRTSPLISVVIMSFVPAASFVVEVAAFGHPSTWFSWTLVAALVAMIAILGWSGTDNEQVS